MSYDGYKLEYPEHYDYIDEERSCPICGEIFGEESNIEVEDYSECLECLVEDPEIIRSELSL